ncbi:MAG TPA: hypothetical protein DEF68_07925 [Elusimicrobia bacterium]|nr:hypothetical protein [Elusimicrobiota bacterium]
MVTTAAAEIGFSLSPEQLEIASQDLVGFRFGDRGTHTSRTIMLEELSTLMQDSDPATTRAEYRSLIIDQNCLGKRTAATRKLSDQRLSELYGLDPRIMIFRLMRRLWQSDERGRPLLALLLALARDPLLRMTAQPIIRMRTGEELGRQTLTDALNRGTGSRFNEAVLDKIVRNTSASWTQSGHLKGHSRKNRQPVRPTPIVATYALTLGYILGARGHALLETIWAKVLDISTDELIFIAMDAKRAGYIDLKSSGGVIDISPVQLFTDEERRLLHGTN